MFSRSKLILLSMSALSLPLALASTSKAAELTFACVGSNQGLQYTLTDKAMIGVEENLAQGHANGIRRFPIYYSKIVKAKMDSDLIPSAVSYRDPQTHLKTLFQRIEGEGTINVTHTIGHCANLQVMDTAIAEGSARMISDGVEYEMNCYTKSVSDCR